MTSDRKKPGVAYWATVVVVVLGGYVLSVGPAEYLFQRRLLPDWAVVAGQWFYLPLGALPERLTDWIERYAEWFAHALP